MQNFIEENSVGKLSLPNKGKGARCHGVYVSASVPEVPGSKPDSTEEPPCMQAWSLRNLMSWDKRPPAGVVQHNSPRPNLRYWV
ncbi:hypothetical protein AVEN_88218-1 [Araneus ventricosus]|uniref:Uncharacterized protein n=1 Tax=Araneus ventricosus TaxID=182803 RepID=A0A4Y2HWN8_ARAVE|nr:hypothetical protein AVEN_88218-1 [Araneus ventricosus]